MTARRRRCIILRGTESETQDEALTCIESLDQESVLWVSDEPISRWVNVLPVEVKRLLGVSYDVVVLDIHRGIDADLIGQCHGFIWGGGALILRMPPTGRQPQRGQERFVVHPYALQDVGHRFYRRFEDVLDRARLQNDGPLIGASHVVKGTQEQAQVVAQLTALFTRPTPQVAVLISDRGRGKSSALGLALKGALAVAPLRIAVTAANEASVTEVFRFARGATDSQIEFVAPESLAYGDDEYQVVIVDEAAQLSVQLLQKITLSHPHAHLALATTTHGYEGTGRGFALRFVEWLKHRSPSLTSFSLSEPIRWGQDDPLEAFIYDALLLDAQAAPLPHECALSEVEHTVLDRDQLLENDQLLRDFFGLLVHAHYRTTPSDLHRILDAPNLRLHALLVRGRVAAATLVALEGGLPQETVEALYWGRTRVRGNALAETLISHSGHQEAGELSMVRSIRIAVHPELRRRGLASTLVDHIHRTYEPDLFGTLFGVTPGLLEFRRHVGYEVVRVGASRGSRTGEPAVVMLRPVSPRADRLFRSLRRELARDLPAQFELHNADANFHLDPVLERALRANLPSAAELSDEAYAEAVAAFAFGPRTVESTALALAKFVEEHRDVLTQLTEIERSLIETRIVNRQSWEAAMESTALPSLPATMRATRRAFRRLVILADPTLENRKPVPTST